MRNATAWYSVRGSNPSGQLERLVTSPEVERCETGAPGESRTPKILFLRQARIPVPSPGRTPIRLCPIAGGGMPTRFARCARALIQHIAPSRSRGRSWAPGARTHPNWSGYGESNPRCPAWKAGAQPMGHIRFWCAAAAGQYRCETARQVVNEHPRFGETTRSPSWWVCCRPDDRMDNEKGPVPCGIRA